MRDIVTLPDGESIIEKDDIEKYIKPKVIFDVGAYDGRDSLRYRKMFPNAEIHMFEANPHVLTKKRITKLKNKNIKVNVLGVFNKETKLEFGYYKRENKVLSNGSFYFKEWNDEYNTIEVNTITLEKYCDLNQIIEIDFIQIDAESSEADILYGMGALRPKIIFIELHHQVTPIGVINRARHWLEMYEYEKVYGTLGTDVDFLFVMKDLL